ncbi:hypothetical protein PsYK624_162010 [Phanerochaete sordida]|uniref:Uncharacterized protein n=1 Tax=Phanerochaete sordida TaxID=48140 RepID=A0A9P3LM11_9APHY|nr:hypothetical protein PsYK624_162010 [Phanerochaete sordida]
MSARKSVYTCDCHRFCGGELRPVSRSAFYDHKKHRSADSRASAVTIQDGFTTVKGTRRRKAKDGNSRAHGSHAGATIGVVRAAEAENSPEDAAKLGSRDQLVDDPDAFDAIIVYPASAADSG